MIYYHQGTNNIAFSFDADLERRIIAQRIECGEEHFFAKNVMGLRRGSSLTFKFNVISNDVIFFVCSGFRISEKASNLEILNPPKTTWDMYSERKDGSRAIVFNIDAEIYAHLTEWKNWNVEESLTSRYNYEFSLDCSMLDTQIEMFDIYDKSSKTLFHIYRDDYYGEIGHNVINNPTWYIF